MIWTLPNILTAARIAAAPVIAVVFLLMTPGWAHLVAFVVFTAAALTDFLDGWLARRLGQHSDFGRMLDPIADKAMVTIALAALMGRSGFAAAIVLPATAILLREVVVSGLREHLGAVKLHVTPLAKWKTAAQMVAIGGLFLAGGLGSFAVERLALALLWLAAGLTIWTGIDYFRKAIPHLRGGS